MNTQRQHDYSGNFFPLPNAVFHLGLSPGAFTVYSFLRCSENRTTHQCWPSYKTIGRATGMSSNTVRKCVCELVDKGLIRTENTSVITKAGLKRNGSLLYTILPFQGVLDSHYQQQLNELKLAEAQRKWTQKVKGRAEILTP